MQTDALPDVLLHSILQSVPLRYLGCAVQTCRRWHEAASAVVELHLAGRRLMLPCTPVAGEGWVAMLRMAEQWSTISSYNTHTLWIVGGQLHSSGGDPMYVPSARPSDGPDLSLLGLREADRSIENPARWRPPTPQKGWIVDSSCPRNDVVIRPVAALASVRVVEVATGATHSLALSDDGAVFAFGRNSFGQLGKGGLTEADQFGCPPQRVASLDGVVARRVGCGAYFSLVIDALGQLHSFGSNQYGELCRGEHMSKMAWVVAPTRVSVGDGARLLQAVGGRGHTLLLTMDGRVFAAGRHDFGQLGDGTLLGDASREKRETPRLVHLYDHFCVGVAAGNNHSIAVTAEGHVYGWGANDKGQVLPGGEPVVPTPISIVHQFRHPPVVRAAAGTLHTVLLTDDGAVYVLSNTHDPSSAPWRERIWPRPMGSSPDYRVPVMRCQLPAEVCAGWRHTIVADGSPRKIVAWGDAEFGQCGFDLHAPGRDLHGASLPLDTLVEQVGEQLRHGDSSPLVRERMRDLVAQVSEQVRQNGTLRLYHAARCLGVEGAIRRVSVPAAALRPPAATLGTLAATQSKHFLCPFGDQDP